MNFVEFLLFYLIAKQQTEVQKRLNSLKAEVDKRDQDIKQLQRGLKDAESVLVRINEKRRIN